MNNYITPELKMIIFQENDIVRTSPNEEKDNMGGVGDWE